MKTRHLRTLACAWALCGAVFLCASDAHAATLVAQTTNTGSCVLSGAGCAGPSGSNQIAVGTGVVASIQVYLVGSAGDYYDFILGDNTIGAGDVCYVVGTLAISTSGSYLDLPCTGSQNGVGIPGPEVSAGDSMTMTPSQAGLPAASSGTNGIAFNTAGFAVYYEAFDANGNEGSLSRFVEPYSPSNGSYSTTSPTTFSAGYYFNCDTDFGLYDSLTFQITDTSNPNRNPVVSSQPLSICGGGTLSAAVTLTPGDTYLWRPEMYSSAGSSTPLFGNWYFFDSTSTPAEDINTAVGATVGTSTLPVTTNLLSFLNVPVLLETKFPFAYVFEIANGIQAGIAASSSNAIPSGDFVWSNFTGGTTTTDFFSQSTIEYYLSPTLISLWRSFLVVILYVGVGYALYHRARKDLNLK